MRPTPETDDLDLPPLDGTLGGAEGDEENGGDHGADDIEADDRIALGDAFDDATAEDDPLEELAADGEGVEAEAGWLLDSEGTASLDVGAFDISLSDEGKLLEDEEPTLRPVEEDLGDSEETVHADGGEEGPLADDEELREEDLPALDADDEGDVDDASLYDGASITLDEELRWEDRAWARVEVPVAGAPDENDDGGLLALPGDDPKHAARDATWRRHEESGRITAVVLVPGESVVVALDGRERPMLVRIQIDGVARIIAEIESPVVEDEAMACRVTSLRWDESCGCLIATGTFGAQAFSPA